MTRPFEDIIASKQHLERLEALRRDRLRILALPADQAADAILDHPQARALVHSFAEEDLFFLIHDIGPEDALDLIALASSRQWEYLLDMESWEKDRIHFPALTRWLDLLLAADFRRFLDWSSKEHPELMEYYLFKTVDVVVREHDQDPSDFEDGYITYDDVYYVRLPDEDDDGPAEPGARQHQKEFLSRYLDGLAGEDHVFYQQTLFRAGQVIPAETEEEAYRLRNVRLAEKGFLPFDEAVGVYQPLRPDQMRARKKILRPQTPEEPMATAPIGPIVMMDRAGLFSQALSRITAEDILYPLQSEFAGVCNRIIAADGQPVRSRQELAAVVKKACAYISIGLERLSGKAPKQAWDTLAKCLETYPLIDLFRAGYGLVADLRTRAGTWMKTAWYARYHLPLTFWGERLTGVIGGLLLPRPRFYLHGRPGAFYREFETLADIQHADAALKDAVACDALLSQLAIHPSAFPKGRLVTCQNLLLTLWARQALGLPETLAPIPVDVFRPFLDGLWTSGKTAQKGPQIKKSKKTAFLKWLSARTGRPEHDLSQEIGKFLEGVFAEAAADLSAVAPASLDPRFVHLFLLC